MLVVSRKAGETIHIGKDITITIVEVDRGKIRVGIQAPKDISIYRGELLQANENAQEAGKRLGKFLEEQKVSSAAAEVPG
jgi:carbon storage regulator